MALSVRCCLVHMHVPCMDDLVFLCKEVCLYTTTPPYSWFVRCSVACTASVICEHVLTTYIGAKVLFYCYCEGISKDHLF